MPDKTSDRTAVELSNGPEYRVLANFFGVLLACSGLLVGTMVHERSLDYWQSDLVPLLILLITGRGLLKSSMDLMRDSMVYGEKKQVLEAFLAKQSEVLTPEPGEMPKLAAKPHYSEEEVLEAVSKRIEQQRDKAVKTNKFSH